MTEQLHEFTQLSDDSINIILKYERLIDTNECRERLNYEFGLFVGILFRYAGCKNIKDFDMKNRSLISLCKNRRINQIIKHNVIKLLIYDFNVTFKLFEKVENGFNEWKDNHDWVCKKFNINPNNVPT